MKQPNSPTEKRARPIPIALLAILLLALLLRLVRLGYADYWHDEVHNFMKVKYIWTVLTEGEFVSNHPPMFTILLWVWSHLGLAGSEFSARLLTVLLGIAGVMATYWAGRRLFDESTALVAAGFMAISPFAIHHAQDLKDYILLPIFCSITAPLIWRASETNRPRDWAWYGLFACLCCYADIYSAPFLVGINLWFLFQLPGRANRLPGWTIANTVGAIGFLPYFFILWNRFNLMIIHGEDVWIPKPGVTEVVILAKTIVFGYSSMDPAWKIALLLWGIASLAGLVAATRKNARLGLLIFCWMILPVILTYGVSHIRQSIFLYRGLIWLTVPTYLAVAYAITRIPATKWRVTAVAPLCALAALSLYQRYTFQYSVDEFPHRPAIHAPRQYHEAAQHILDNWREGDVVVEGSTSAWYSMMYYGLQGKPHFSTAPNAAAIRTAEASYPRTTRRPEMASYFPRFPSEAVAGFKRIWFVFDDWERAYFEPNVMPSWRWIDGHFTEIDHCQYGEFDLYLYDADPAARPVERISDDGVTATLRLPGRDAIYTKARPDTGLVRTPVESRRGRLTLAWQSEEDESTPINLRSDTTGPEKSWTFSLRNQSEETITTRIMVVPSDALFEAATLTPNRASDHGWTINEAYNPAPPPQNHPLSVAVGKVVDEITGVVTAAIPNIAPGSYATAVYYMGYPNQPAYANAPIQLSVSGVDLFAALETPENDTPAWHWLPGALVTLDTPSPGVELRTHPLPGVPEAYVNLGFIAFRRNQDQVAVFDQSLPIGPGTHNWTVHTDAEVGRIDVFVLEYAPDGRAYRIFTQMGTP